MGVSQIKM